MDLDRSPVVLPLEVHVDLAHGRSSFGLDRIGSGPAWVQNLHYFSEGPCSVLHSDPELLEVDVDIEKFQKAVLWKMGYFHVTEMVVERGYPLGNSLEEVGLDLLGLVGTGWV